LLIVVAALVWLDSPGPVFFVQRRYGFNQQPFRIIKFRTMRTLDDGPVIAQATRDDPRLTRIGRFLRRWKHRRDFRSSSTCSPATCRWSARGRMRCRTITNTRSASRSMPAATTSSRASPVGRNPRLRGEIDTDEKMRRRLEHDLFYIDNWSLWLDLQIIFRTVLSPAGYRNAY